jgi:protein O-GlcNAc transferase
MSPTHYDLANDLLLKGQLDAAIVEYRKALAAEPLLAEALQNLGAALNAKGDFEQAEAVLRQAIAIRPDLVLAYGNLGAALSAQKQLVEAVEMFRQALSLSPNLLPAMCNLGEALHLLGQLTPAIEILTQAFQLAPDVPEVLNNLGRSLKDAGQLDDALAILERCVELRPDMAPALGNLGNAYRDAGDISSAIGCYTRAMEVSPHDASMHSNLIYALQYDPQHDEQSLLYEQRRWNDLHAAPFRSSVKPHHNARSADRKLRIGYVSPYFYFQAESFFIVPLLENHDHGHFEIHCYSDVIAPDETTRRLKASADVWHDVKSLNAVALAEQIRGDEIDILIDLTMHMGGNRLSTFAQKPAPVQITWLAYPGGTGLDAMDYRFTDAYIDPRNAAKYYCERSIALPDCWCCYDALRETPPVSTRAAGPIRFGSINNPCKHNEPTLIRWAKTMRKVVGSRLLIQSLCEMDRARIRAVFSQNEIAPDRIEFTGRKPRDEYLRLYESIDIGLDPLPYNGITTTCDALWMGVPVVTLRGNTAAGRAGASILSTVGLPELIAENDEQFVQIAGALADDKTRLAELRSTMRSRMRHSPLTDGQRFARGLESAYRGAWLEYAREQS